MLDNIYIQCYNHKIKAVTKTVSRLFFQRVGGWCEPIITVLKKPITSELKG